MGYGVVVPCASLRARPLLPVTSRPDAALLSSLTLGNAQAPKKVAARKPAPSGDAWRQQVVSKLGLPDDVRQKLDDEGIDDLGSLLDTTVEELKALGIKGGHAKKLFRYSQDAAGQPGKVHSGAVTPGLVWPAHVRKHMFRKNCMDVLNKLMPDKTEVFLQIIVDRYEPDGGADYVFISHASKDDSKQVFQVLSTFFRAKGITVFNPTTAFMEEDASKDAMEKAAAGAKVVVAALSDGFFQSKWCLAEIAAAQASGTDVVPVYSGDFHSNNKMEAWVAGRF